MRTITTCAGIGDFLFIAGKLLHTNERFHFRIPDGSPQRGKQIFDLLPNIAASCTYTPNLSYSIVKQNNAGAGLWSDIKQQEFYLEANAHLEAGKRIEEFLPDLPVSYRLEYATSAIDAASAQILLSPGKPVPSPKYIGIYVSAYRNNNRHWNMWRETEWVPFIRMIHKECPETCFVIIGAEYDSDHSAKVMQQLGNIPYIDTIGQPLSVVVELLKWLSYFVGFPSGLSILNETLGKPGIMFYPKHLLPMMNAWADPARIESGDYKAVQLCTPEKLFEWVKDEYKLFEKI